MDDDLKKSCPSCSQLYSLQLTSSKVKGNLPLFLPCGHTTCENCIVNIMKCLEPIECKICFRDADIKGADPNELVLNKTMLYQKFPVNFQMVGELTMNLMKTPGATKKTEEDAFIDLKSLMKSDAAQGHCLECNITTSKMCKECVTILCEACFNKPHKNFVMFKNHVLQSIVEGNMQWSTCKLHIGKPLDYYCNDCKKPVCTDCMMLGGEKSCKNHDVVSLQEVNAMFLDELTNIAPQVDETFRRLTNTAVDIGYLLYNYDDTGAVKELFKIIDSVEQHFSKLFSIIQKHKDDILNIILYLEFSEKNALQKAKSEVANSIKKAKNVLKMITLATENKNIKQMNLPALLEDAKQVANTPWFLNKTEASKRTLKVTVNEDLCSLVSDYVHLEGNVKTVYKLHSTSELDVEVPPAPPNPVYPPELPKDGQSKPKVEKEIQKPPTLYKRAPKYRSKIGSEMISLNSNCSNNSNRSYISLNSYQQQPIIQPVSPFLENQLHPSPLSEGAQELIYISHIVDPSNFFVQRACNQGLVKDMVREFRNAVSFAKPSQNHITPGKSYLVFDKAGNMWQRCRVLSIDMKKSDPIVQVFCFDFGNIEFVTLDKLRLLPPSKIQCPDPLAINCSLFNCVPKTGNWTYEDAFLIHNIIDNKQAVIHIRRIIPLSNVDFKLECDMNTFEHGISIAHALVFHDRAKMPYPRLRYPAIHGIKEKLKLYTNNNETYSENLEPVYLTHVISPDKFYVRKLHLQKAFEKLTEDLEQEYSLASNVGTVYLPEKGMVCAVNLERCRLETLGSWARGVVLERVGRGRVRVWLPDVGLTLLLHWCSLRYIHPKFTTVSALSTECYLAGVTPFNKKWSAASVELLQKFMGYTLELQVEDNRNRFHRSHGSIGVTLYYKPDSDTVICINNEMVKHNFAVSFGIYTFNKTPVEEQVLTNKSPLEKPSPPAPSKPKIKILKRNMPMDVINDDDLLAKDKDPVRLEVKILNCQSPSLIYVSFMLQQNNFKNMFEEMQKYYSKNTENKTKKDWQVGDRCATLCIQSQTWRRAVIMELENDNAKVVYSDFAFIETVPKSSLREIISEFTNYGDAAIKCHLFGIKPARGEEWPIITKDFLKELIDASKSFFVTKVGNFKDNSMPIELWVYHTEQGGALEPNKSSWHCVNQRILSQGLCVADKTQVVTSEHKTDNTEDTLSFLNITGSVNEWLQLEPMPMAPLNTGKPDEDIITASSSLSIVEDEDYKSFPRDGRESSNIMYITDWLPPEPLSCKEFTSMPTHIDNDGIIYLHDVCQQDSLDLIRKVLDLNPKALDPDPKAKFTKWSVGEPCVALYYLDNRYYRGRVVEVNKENSSCIIHYIDFGNEETCSFKNLRKSVPLHQIPTQAHKCMLNRIRPLGKQWDRNILDYIHKCIVEKKCYTKVTGEPVNGIVPIDIEYDKLWINDHLVKFEMAEYTDGSKALVRKYAPVEKINEEDDVIESDSGPDDIVVDDADTTTEQLSPTSTSDSSDISSLEGLEADWNTLIDQEESSFDEHYFTYTRHMDDEFSCNITIINDLNTLQLSLIFDDDITRMYEKMFEELQTESMNMPHLNGIFENKACVAIFPEDNLWYRASILQFCEKTNKVKVRYVDYGNISVIYLADIREIDEEWAKLPPATITAKLFGVRLNPDVDITEIKKEYTELFLGKGPFHVKVVSYDDSVPLVEMKNEEQELVYKNLIENNMLIPSV